MSLLIAAAVGGYALASSHTDENANLASSTATTSRVLYVTACLSAGNLSDVSVTSTPTCAAGATMAHWATRSSSIRSFGSSVTLAACLSAGKLSDVSLTSTPKCSDPAVLTRWAAQRGRAGGFDRYGAMPDFSTRGLTVSACLSAGKLSHVSLTGSARCRGRSTAIHWSAHPGAAPAPGPLPTSTATSTPTATPSASTSSSSPSTPPTSTDPTPSSTATSSSPAPSQSSSSAPAPAPTGSACVASSDNGACGPYSDSSISGSNASVIQDIWNPISGAQQTLTAYNPGDWSVSADMPNGNTAVVSYPDVQTIYTTTSNTPDPLTNFKSITSSYSENGPGSGGGDDYEAAYDIWAGPGSANGSHEIMIWVDNHGQTPAGSDKGTVSIDGTSYGVWSNGGSTVSLVLSNNETSGTINVLADLQWLESNGYEPSGLGVNQIDFGWEICSTGGVAKTFNMTSFSISTS